MAEKKKTKKEKVGENQMDLKEILGDIKDVVAGEKEALFKVSEYKTISLKKENLLKSGSVGASSEITNMSNGKLERLIRTIVKEEINRLQLKEKSKKISTPNIKAKNSTSKSLQSREKVKPIAVLNKMTKKELEDYGRMFGLEVDRRLTKDKIISQVSKLK